MSAELKHGAAPTPTLTPTLAITAELIDELIGTGGYTHHLFNPSAEQRRHGQTPPLPGQAVLLLAGGLVEQSGILDHGKALLELKSVRFLAMVHAGSTLRVEVTPGTERTTSTGKIIGEYRWQVLNETGACVVEATAVMMLDERKA